MTNFTSKLNDAPQYGDITGNKNEHLEEMRRMRRVLDANGYGGLTTPSGQPLTNLVAALLVHAEQLARHDEAVVPQGQSFSGAECYLLDTIRHELPAYPVTMQCWQDQKDHEAGKLASKLSFLAGAELDRLNAKEEERFNVQQADI